MDSYHSKISAIFSRYEDTGLLWPKCGLSGARPELARVRFFSALGSVWHRLVSGIAVTGPPGNRLALFQRPRRLIPMAKAL